MNPSKKNITEKKTLRENAQQQYVKPGTSASSTSAFPTGSEIHEHLRQQLRIPATADVRGPPQVLYQTAHSEPTRQAAHDTTSEPTRIHSAADLIPHLLPPSRNGIYPTMVVNDFYDSISINSSARRLPPCLLYTSDAADE